MSFSWHEIRDNLMHSSSTLSFQRSFDAIRGAHHLLTPFPDPAAVLDGLHHAPGDPDRKNEILTALTMAAQRGGPASDCALTLLLLALWPGLDAIRRRSIWRSTGTLDEVASDVLARTTEAIRHLDLHRVTRVAATILRNVERDMIRARRREADRERASADVDPDKVLGEQSGPHTAPEDRFFEGDLHKLIGADADLVIRVAIQGFSQTEAAGEMGLTEAAARKRYQRATRRLREAFHKFV